MILASNSHSSPTDKCPQDPADIKGLWADATAEPDELPETLKEGASCHGLHGLIVERVVSSTEKLKPSSDIRIIALI